MNSEGLINLFAFSHGNIKSIVQEVSFDAALKVPDGFNNSILWNVGHILLAAEQFLFVMTDRESILPEHYKQLFSRGTKPSEWTMEPPSLDSLLEQLDTQSERVKLTFSENTNEKMPTPFQFPGLPPLETVGDVLLLTMYHETMHTGQIKALKRLVSP
jgi:uncharacterized damage-inducible protein DinB